MKAHYSILGCSQLANMMECIHSGEIILEGDHKVMVSASGFESINRPNAPEYNGTLIDWSPDSQKSH